LNIHPGYYQIIIERLSAQAKNANHSTRIKRAISTYYCININQTEAKSHTQVVPKYTIIHEVIIIITRPPRPSHHPLVLYRTDQSIVITRESSSLFIG
jgi:hypothetical protein